MGERAPSAMGEALRHDSDKQAYVDWIFRSVARRYDLGNDLMSMGWHTRWKRRLLDLCDPQPGMHILDVAAGTGDVTWMLAERLKGEGLVIGSDINADMMRPADAKRPPGCTTEVRWELGDVGQLPYPDASFDMVTCSYAGRGFPDWAAAVREIHRVLKPGGTFWNLDFARPPQRSWDKVYRGYMTVSGAMLGTALHRDPRTYMYIPASMKHYPGQRWLDEQMRAAGFHTELIETWFTLMAYNKGTKPA